MKLTLGNFLIAVALLGFLAIGHFFFLHFWVYLLIFIGAMSTSILCMSTMWWFHDDVDYVVAAFIFSVVVCVVLNLGFDYAYTKEELSHIKQEQAEDVKPYLVSHDMGNGCTVNYWYGYGKKQSYTAKYVNCPNSKTISYENYACGSPKVPKNCQRETVTNTK